MFDCLLQDFLIAELQACGLELTSLKILQPYIVKNREYKLKKKQLANRGQKFLLGYGVRGLSYFTSCVTCFYLYLALILQTMEMLALHCSGKHIKEVDFKSWKRFLNGSMIIV